MRGEVFAAGVIEAEAVAILFRHAIVREAFVVDAQANEVPQRQ